MTIPNFTKQDITIMEAEEKQRTMRKNETDRYYYCDVCDNYVLPYIYTSETKNDIHWEITCPCGNIIDED